MPLEPILISNFQTGLENDLEPWLLPNDAFPGLTNCYVFRGRVIRTLGPRRVGRLQRYDPIGGINLGMHTTQPQTFGPTSFPNTPVNRGSVSITDGTVTYTDNGDGQLIGDLPAQGITGISQAVNAVISFAGAPLFNNGDQVWVTGVQGMTGINNQPLTISAIGATSITVNYDSSAQPAWTAGGSVVWYGGTIDYFTGSFTVTFYNAITGTNVIASAQFYPGLPVMGLTQQETATINQENLIAFDQNKAYRLSNVTQQFQDISFDTSISTQTGAFSWNSSNSDFFWSINYANAVFTTNFVSGDPIRYLAIANTGGNPEVWRPFAPTLDGAATRTLSRARMIFSYRGRLVVINTVEAGSGAGTFPQRARWSQNGTPYYNTGGGVDTPPAPFSADANAWADDIAGKGGFIDAPTREAAVSGEFIDDTLIVYFEKSTWLLRYQGDPANPFVWERVNQDFGSESTFSTITFDKGLFTVGNVGITTCDGNDITRIDQKIPDEVFNFQNKNEGPKRVHGIRNFKRQLVYWTFPNDVGGVFPNRVLLVNYIEASYAFLTESYTCFGYFEPSLDITWARLTAFWSSWNYTWSNPTGQSFEPQIVAGNQQGFVVQIDSQILPDPTLFVSALTITSGSALVTSPNHNLAAGQFIAFTGLQGTGNLSQFQNQLFRIDSVVGVNTFIIAKQDGSIFDPSFAYTDGGEIMVYNNFEIETKRFNLGLKEGRQTSLSRTDFYVDRDDDKSFEVDLYVDEDNSQPITTFVSTSPQPPTSLNLAKVWQRDYTRLIGQLYQYIIKLSDAQMFAEFEDVTNFALHGMIMWVEKAGRLTR